MSVLHVNVPSFPIEVERLVDRRLRGRPVAVAASTSPRAPLLYVSTEAFSAGIYRGMMRREAGRWERSLICLTPNENLYQRAQQKLLEVVSRFTPVFEPMRLGAVFLDMKGTELLFGKTNEAASKIRKELLSKLRLDPELGVARNKLVSRVAAKVMRPHGLYEVYEGHEAEFLHPLAVDYLPGVGPITSGKLFRELGIRHIGQLAAIPVPLLVQLFGRAGVQLHDKACGQDDGFVRGDCSELSVIARSAATKQSLRFEAILSEPTNDDGKLLAELWRLCERAGADLRKTGKMVFQSILEAVYVDGLRIHHKTACDPPTQSDFALFRPWKDSWKKFMERRLQLKSLALILQGLQSQFEQLDFATNLKEKRILSTVDQLRRRYGELSIRFWKIT